MILLENAEAESPYYSAYSCKSCRRDKATRSYLVDDGIVRLGGRGSIDLLEQLEEVVAAPTQGVMCIGSLICFGITLQTLATY